jgi:hypothetical protein
MESGSLDQLLPSQNTGHPPLLQVNPELKHLLLAGLQMQLGYSG